MSNGPTLVDTNIILDIIRLEPDWAAWSLRTLSAQEEPVVNPIIFAELCYRSASAEEVEKLLLSFEIGFEEISKAALFLASQAYKQYRQRGGNKLAPLPDFFIGAQAYTEGWPLLTRDVLRYRTYFPGIHLLCP